MTHWPLALYRVEGESMLPTYRPADLLLGRRWVRRLRPGQIVVAVVDARPVVKRVAAIGEAGVTLAGDNTTASTDSRHYGPIEPSQVEAIIIARLSQ